MHAMVQFELEHNRQRLAYYTQLKGQRASKQLSKWIEIYSERVKRLERQVTKVGLRTEAPAKAAPSKRKTG